MDTHTARVDTTTIKTGTQTRSFDFHRTTTFVGLLIGYAGYYLCRQNFAAAYPAMKDLVHMDKATFGQISSFGTLMYAFGKVTTGAAADTIGGRIVFFIGLVGSVLLSLLFGMGSGIGFFFVVWGAQRFFQSMGWGGLVNVMSRWFSSRQYGTAMGVMSINYQFGGVLATVFAGYLLSLGFGWRALFFIPALVLAAIGVVGWFLIKGCPTDVGHELRHDDAAGPAAGSVHASDANLSYLARFKLVLSDPAFLVMCALSFIITLLRECFNTWMPAYFSDMGASASMAAFKSAVFPLMGCVGTLFAGWFSDKYLQGRRGPMMASLMVVLVALL
ncbi:MAG: MFS transporter, partial [Deltaproteobacteria bacterium]|nr:MFS transporter [Deltaproteobacteria bacterium]